MNNFSFTLIKSSFESLSYCNILICNICLLSNVPCSHNICFSSSNIGLPTVFHIFSYVVPVEERSRSFSYMVTFGAVGQTVATLVCPHLIWSHSFFIFGFIGLVWICFWIPVFNVVRRAESRIELPAQQSQVSFNSSIFSLRLSTRKRCRLYHIRCQTDKNPIDKYIFIYRY